MNHPIATFIKIINYKLDFKLFNYRHTEHLKTGLLTKKQYKTDPACNVYIHF